MKRSGRLGLSLAAGAVCLFGQVQVAWACSCGGGEVDRTTPADGAVYPANADIVLWDRSACVPVGSESLAATVDGAPATLTESERFFASASGVSALQVRVSPAPAVGQVVTIFLCPVGDLCAPDAEGAEVVLTYTAGEPDTTAPPQPSIAGLALERFMTFCGDMAEGWEVGLASGGASPEEPLVYTFELSPASGGSAIAPQDRRQITEDTQPFSVEFHVPGGASLPADAADVCVRVTASDLAGNAAAPVELCGATGGEDGGCGCRSGGGSAGLSLAALVLLGRRRSRGRRSPGA